MNSLRITESERDIEVIVSNGLSDSFRWIRSSSGSLKFGGTYEGRPFTGDVDECTITNNEIHIVLGDGRLIHLYWRGISRADIDVFSATLSKIYPPPSRVVEINL
jgi:hypothetical protein